MPNLPNNQYECDMCHGIFDKVNNDEWNDFKAQEEIKQLFGNIPRTEQSIVCDDCWQIIKPLGAE